MKPLLDVQPLGRKEDKEVNHRHLSCQSPYVNSPGGKLVMYEMQGFLFCFSISENIKMIWAGKREKSKEKTRLNTPESLGRGPIHSLDLRPSQVAERKHILRQVWGSKRSLGPGTCFSRPRSG